MKAQKDRKSNKSLIISFSVTIPSTRCSFLTRVALRTLKYHVCCPAQYVAQIVGNVSHYIVGICKSVRNAQAFEDLVIDDEVVRRTRCALQVHTRANVARLL